MPQVGVHRLLPERAALGERGVGNGRILQTETFVLGRPEIWTMRNRPLQAGAGLQLGLSLQGWVSRLLPKPALGKGEGYRPRRGPEESSTPWQSHGSPLSTSRERPGLSCSH